MTGSLYILVGKSNSMFAGIIGGNRYIVVESAISQNFVRKSSSCTIKKINFYFQSIRRDRYLKESHSKSIIDLVLITRNQKADVYIFQIFGGKISSKLKILHNVFGIFANNSAINRFIKS